MNTFKPYHKIGIKFILIIFLICCIFIIGITSFLRINRQKSERHFAIMPHFMLDSEKVNQFYNFIKDKYYNGGEPNKIILISPNHFHDEEMYVKSICNASTVTYKSNSIKLYSYLSELGVKCDSQEELFFKWGNALQTNEHGVGEHFKWINKYFPNSDVIPLISPCFKLSAANDISHIIENLNGNILVIASVDFSHYQHEQQTLQHDEKSIETLKSMMLDESEFIDGIDADCPACLYLLQSLAQKQGQKPELWWRDSSSTILNQDMEEENTSRIFMRYE